MTDTTLVGLTRLRDVQIFENRIGTVVQSYSTNPPAGCLYLGNDGTEVSKTEWIELYTAIGGEDGSDSSKFVIPYLPDSGSLKHYIVGKILLTDINTSGNVAVKTFTQQDLDSSGRITFIHGFGHNHPILQLLDQNMNEVQISNRSDSVGQVRINITSSFNPTITGTWTLLAIG